MIFPWTHSQWQQLIERFRQHRLPHALLFNGQAGLGKLEFAKQFSNAILCESPEQDGQACHKCRSCTQFSAETHPDYYLIEPEEAGKAIKVDQIRGLIEQFSLASHYGYHRVAIICPANAMNPAAANSLLKTLEEPPANTLILLISSEIAVLPATILSRCQRMDFSLPSSDMATNWLNKQHQEGLSGKISELLAMANGAPLKAINYSDSGQLELRNELFRVFCDVALEGKSAITDQNPWLKSEITTPIQWLYSWVSDLIKLQSRCEQAIVNTDKLTYLQKIAQQVELGTLYRYLDKIIAALRLQGAPLNKQMVMDDLFLDWQSITKLSK